MKKIVVVGSGVGGLISGAYLAKSGYDVTVIEKHFMPGGYATNFARKTPSGEIVKFDVSLHGIGNLSEGRNLHEKLKNLGVFERLKPLRKKETATLYYKDIKDFDIPDSFEEYKKALISKFPDEENNIINLFNFLKDFDDDMEFNVNKRNTLPKYFQDLQSVTLYEFLKRYTNNEDLIEVFGFLWGYYGLPPSKMNALFYIVAWISYHIGGTFYLEGGGGNFTKVLSDIIKENNGQVILKQEVVKLNTKDNKIISVETSKGEVFEADIFIINACPQHIFSKIDNQELVKDYINRLDKLEESLSLCQLYIATDCNPEELGITKSDLFYNNIHSDKGYEHILNKNYQDVPFCLVNYNLLDPNFNKNVGCLALTIVDSEKNWPQYGSDEYKEQKEKVEKIFMERLFELFPKLKDRVITTEFGTPHTMKKYTNNVKGSVYGFAQDLTSAGFERLEQKTCLDNTYISSAWTQPGGGYEGTIRAGIRCAESIIQLNNSAEKSGELKEGELMPPSVLMRGMAYKANKSYAKNLEVNYKFSFTDINESYFISVDKGKIKLQDNIDNVDVEIICTYKTWHDISNKILDGSNAFRQGLLKVKGNLELFMHIPNLFQEKDKDTPVIKNERKLFKGNILIPITLIPWIFYWIAGDYLNPAYIGFFGILFTLLVSNLKPKFAREITIFESITTLSFSVYLLIFIFYPTENYIYFELLLPIALIVSCFFEPATAQYSKWAYPSVISENTLFKTINVHITLVWAAICIVQFIIAKLIFAQSVFGNLAYILNVILVVFSVWYPKKIMGN